MEISYVNKKEITFKFRVVGGFHDVELNCIDHQRGSTNETEVSERVLNPVEFTYVNN
jgi:hypothetical protein